MNDNNISTKQLIGLMSLAYAFSFLVRMIWVWQFKDTSSFYWDDQLMINTNDGYAFASGVQAEIFNLHINNPRIPDMWNYGIVFFTTIIVKLTQISIETAILYMPSIISSIVVIPIILISRLYNKTLWGFFSALLGAITWSYYNRTMTGYYDTDMFSAMAPMFILFFLMKSIVDFNLRSALYAAISIIVYPFLYDQGQAIIYAIGIIYAAYMILHHRLDKVTYQSLILIFVALTPLGFLGIDKPFSYIVKFILLIVIYLFLKIDKLEQKKLIILSGVTFLLFMIFGNVFGLIMGKVMGYLSTGTSKEGLHFYSVTQTVREAGKIPFETFANRTSGSVFGVLIALVGYVVLVVKHRAFILALPLIGIGIFSLWGGLRFTVYAVPVAGMSAVYLFWFLSEKFVKSKVAQISVVALMTAGMIYPNIMHIIGYKVPTVLNKTEVQDLVKLDKIASPKDYTLSWWDYGYPIWYYSDTSTLIDGGKHNNDNFIISKIMQTTSPQQAANLSRLAVETYIDSNYSIAANKIFEGNQNPNLKLVEMRDTSYKLPPKTRDIYLYLPYRMLRIFPTVMLFGNLDLTTGKPLRRAMFYQTRLKKKAGTLFQFANGINFDAKKGEIRLGKQTQKVKYFIGTQAMQNGNMKVEAQRFHMDGELAVIYAKSYNTFLIMDMQTFGSMYVQMFLLGKYDKNLFELVVSSPYSKIYKLKI